MKQDSTAGNCTYPVPENPFGITAMHCRGRPISVEELKPLFDGPMRFVDQAMREEAKKPVDVRDLPPECLH